MKRYSEPAGQEPETVKVRRQEPVSCERCRKKKLKCDRSRSCSNCRARKLVCSSEVGERPVILGGVASSGYTTYNVEEINARVRRLEELHAETLHCTDRPWRKDNNLLEVSEVTQYEDSGDAELAKTATWLEEKAFKAGNEPSTVSVRLANKLYQVMLIIETTVLSDARGVDILQGFIISTIKGGPSHPFDNSLTAILPSRKVGLALMTFYYEQINWTYPLIHMPTLRRLFDDLYDRLESNQKFKYGNLALVSIIFAISAYQSSPSAGLCVERSEAMTHFHSWTLLAQDAIDATNCHSHPTLETLQCLLLVSAHLMTNFGAIASLRTLSGMTLHMARTLCLHQVDSAHNRQLRDGMEVDWAELEVKRRIWWHIVSSDWLLQFGSGTLWGTYTVHPNQMTVNIPTNVEDDEIGSRGELHYAQPPDVPTGMTFSLLRINAAMTCREIIDDAWDMGGDMDNLPYNLILKLDQKINAALSKFEKRFKVFLSSDSMNNGVNNNFLDSHIINRPSEQLLKVQRNLGIFGMHSRLSRLHRSYLIRGARDPQYAYSRMVCLKSTRIVIELGQNMMKTRGVVAYGSWCIPHKMFVSAIILIMDYRFNPDEPRAKDRKDEILECLHTLESRHDESSIPKRGCEHLRSILQEASNDPQLQTGKFYPRALELIELAVKSDTSPKTGEHPPQTTSPTAQRSGNIDSYSDFKSANVSAGNDWPVLDFTSFDNMKFDDQLDVNQFESLFNDLYSNNGMF